MILSCFRRQHLAPPSSYKKFPFCTTQWSALLLVEQGAALFMDHLIKPIRSQTYSGEFFFFFFNSRIQACGHKQQLRSREH